MTVEEIWAEAQRREAISRRKWTFSSLLILSIIGSYVAFSILGFPAESSSTYSLRLEELRTRVITQPSLRQLTGCGYGDKRVQGLRTQSIDAARCGSEGECLDKVTILQERLQSLVYSEARVTCAEMCKGGRGYITGVLDWSRERLSLDTPYEAVVAGEFCCRCS